MWILVENSFLSRLLKLSLKCFRLSPQYFQTLTRTFILQMENRKAGTKTIFSQC